MTTSVLEKSQSAQVPQQGLAEEVDKEELCKKLCLNIFEGLLEGYEDLKLNNPKQAETIETKINELKCERDRQKICI